MLTDLLMNLVTLDIPAGEADIETATFTATTTGAQTLTLQDVAVATNRTVTIDWGDGSSNIYTAGSGTRTHNYAGAGTWTVRIYNPDAITSLDLRDTKITLDMTENARYFMGLTDTLRLENITGTWIVGPSAPMPVLTNTLYLNGNNLNMTWVVGGTGATMPALTGTLWLNGNNFNFTWVVGGTGAAMPALTGTLYLSGNNFNLTWVVGGTGATMPALTGTLWLSGNNLNFTWVVGGTGAAMPALTATLYISGNNLNFTWTPESGAGTTIPRNCDTIILQPNWSTAAVDAFVDAAYTVWAAGGFLKATNWNLAGTNQPATGTWQSMCPPTTPKEKAYQMVNDTCGLGRLKQAAFTLN